MTKPFDMDELLARETAALRRVMAKEQPKSPVIDFDDFHIDRPARAVTVRNRPFTSLQKNSISWSIRRAIPTKSSLIACCCL